MAAAVSTTERDGHPDLPSGGDGGIPQIDSISSNLVKTGMRPDFFGLQRKPKFLSLTKIHVCHDEVKPTTIRLHDEEDYHPLCKLLSLAR